MAWRLPQIRVLPETKFIQALTPHQVHEVTPDPESWELEDPSQLQVAPVTSSMNAGPCIITGISNGQRAALLHVLPGLQSTIRKQQSGIGQQKLDTAIKQLAAQRQPLTAIITGGLPDDTEAAGLVAVISDQLTQHNIPVKLVLEQTAGFCPATHLAFVPKDTQAKGPAFLLSPTPSDHLVQTPQNFSELRAYYKRCNLSPEDVIF
jgi:hypothetical protein